MRQPDRAPNLDELAQNDGKASAESDAKIVLSMARDIYEQGGVAAVIHNWVSPGAEAT
jgi:hypothetical protein